MSIDRELCTACGHDIGRHVQDVIGKVRCFHFEIRSGFFDPIMRDCECTDYACSKPTPTPTADDKAIERLTAALSEREG